MWQIVQADQYHVEEIEEGFCEASETIPFMAIGAKNDTSIPVNRANKFSEMSGQTTSRFWRQQVNLSCVISQKGWWWSLLVG